MWYVSERRGGGGRGERGGRGNTVHLTVFVLSSSDTSVMYLFPLKFDLTYFRYSRVPLLRYHTPWPLDGDAAVNDVNVDSPGGKQPIEQPIKVKPEELRRGLGSDKNGRGARRGKRKGVKRPGISTKRHTGGH